MEHGSEDIASLVASLQRSDKTVVRAAVESLVALGRQQPEVQKALERTMHDLSGQHRWPIAYTLAQLSAPSDLCLDVLVAALGRKDQDIRWATLLLLSRLGTSDERVPSLLLNVLDDGSAVQRRMAVYCLVRTL